MHLWRQGEPEKIITSELLDSIYGVKLNVTKVDDKPFVLTV